MRIKPVLFALVVYLFAAACAWAQVEINTADQAALDGIRGIGPRLSRVILDERQRGGAFKDWVDFETRVSGVGAKSSDRMSRSGLVVAGHSKPGVPPAVNNGGAVASSPAAK
jgi:competence protein ComEA